MSESHTPMISGAVDNLTASMGMGINLWAVIPYHLPSFPTTRLYYLCQKKGVGDL